MYDFFYFQRFMLHTSVLQANSIKNCVIRFSNHRITRSLELLRRSDRQKLCNSFLQSYSSYSYSRIRSQEDEEYRYNFHGGIVSVLLPPSFPPPSLLCGASRKSSTLRRGLCHAYRVRCLIDDFPSPSLHLALPYAFRGREI